MVAAITPSDKNRAKPKSAEIKKNRRTPDRKLF